jgi:G:T-mismatch repair DNA endonuclease (very short patch repair protein)
MTKTCELCGKEYETATASRKYCSRNCSAQASSQPRGPYDSDRVARMAKAKRDVWLSELDPYREPLENLLDMKLVPCPYKLAKLVGWEIEDLYGKLVKKKMEAYIKERLDKWALYKEAPFLPKHLVANLSLKEIERFNEVFDKTVTVQQVQVEFSLDRVVVLNIAKKRGKKLSSRKNTLPEEIAQGLLREEALEWVAQERVPYIKDDTDSYYVFDFVVEGVALEVHGDYWHGNPKMYKEADLNMTQLQNIERDYHKYQVGLSHYGKPVVVWWERDLKNKNKHKKLLEELKEVINGKYNVRAV